MDKLIFGYENYNKDGGYFVDNCINFKFNDPVDLENKIENLKFKGEVYSVIIEPYSASMLTSCSDNFINKLNTIY